MASLDTIILVIVDYHAAIGGARPLCSPLEYAPVIICDCIRQIGYVSAFVRLLVCLLAG